MSQEQEAVVMMCGPRHPLCDEDRGVVCPAAHDGTDPLICLSRVTSAIRVARERGALLIVCGSLDQENDARALVQRARDAEIETMRVTVLGAKEDDWLHVAADVMASDRRFADGVFHLVTDPWNMARAAVMAHIAIMAACRARGVPLFSFKASAVHPSWDPPARVLRREHAGLLAFAAGQPVSGLEI